MIILLILVALGFFFLIFADIYFLAIPTIIVFAFILLYTILVISKQNRNYKKRTAFYTEQLKTFSPNARFMLEVNPLVNADYSNDVEKKVKVMDQVREIARKHGMNPQKQNMHHFYAAGYDEIKNAQKKFVLGQDHGKELLFYLHLSKRDKYNNQKGIRGLVTSQDSDNIKAVVDAMNSSGVANLMNSKYHCADYKAFRDNEKLIAIRSFDEGKAVFTRLKKSHQILPPYYYRWLILDYVPSLPTMIYEITDADQQAKSK